MNMTNKKTSPDILKDVLTSEHDDHVPGLDELTKLIITHTMQQHPQELAKIKEIKRNQRKGIKRKTTHYLSEEVLKDLTEARETIENLLPEHTRSQISKSGIIDTALKMILREWAEKGVKSELFKELLHENNT